MILLHFSGIVPRACEQLFSEIEHRRSQSKTSIYAVKFSMLEIYNENVRDLLHKQKGQSKSLKVKENPTRGFYGKHYRLMSLLSPQMVLVSRSNVIILTYLISAEGLNVVPVGSYSDIRIRMNEGDKQRTIAATKMNETSRLVNEKLCLI